MKLITVSNGEIQLVESATIALRDLIKASIQYDKMVQQLKGELLTAMEEHGVVSFENDIIKATYKKSHTRSSLDTAAIRKEHPDLAELYKKESTVKSSVSVTPK